MGRDEEIRREMRSEGQKDMGGETRIGKREGRNIRIDMGSGNAIIGLLLVLSTISSLKLANTMEILKSIVFFLLPVLRAHLGHVWWGQGTV